uniref:uncharacterized protein LOC122598306 isoform X2 n=1 Tax=Erigeron canadensis TaxID=72917 RepID=UPI001CB8B5CF|nr:uncharacterized protein LOC122598306 isoform X2 [Erigeron canadensis]
MAGGGNNNKQKLKNKSKNRKQSPSVFIEGGLLSDWSPSSKGKDNNNNKGYSGGGGGKSSGSGSNSKPKLNAVGYTYPPIDLLPDDGSDEINKLEEPGSIDLVDTKETKIVASVGRATLAQYETVKNTYDYGASSEADGIFHRGLGFCEEEKDPFVENKAGSISDSSSSEEIETDLSSPEKNSGFLSIGGLKLYTHDVSHDGEGDDDKDEENDEETSGSSESEVSSNSSDSDDSSDIDDEIAKDYIEGIGRSFKDASDEEHADVYGVDIDETIKRLGGITLQDASREYGMKKPRSRKKSEIQPKSIKVESCTDDWSAIDDLMFVKDPRILYAQKKKHAAKSRAEKSNHSRRFPGEKKKQRQDKIASKRRERMIKRGVDLEQINLKLEQMVRNNGDIMSFQLMHSRDCSQIQRLASIYHLRSGSQGSGKRRFVTVTRTEHTGMPSSDDRVRLEKLIGVSNEEADFSVNTTPFTKMSSNKSKKASKGTSGLSPLDSRLTKSKTFSESSKKKRRENDKTDTYATQPVSFISSGKMESELEVTPIDESKLRPQTASSSSYGAFEMHTTGFGSRMMAKMGYVDGGGLGKDGKGIAEPIQAIQRPKSLGLGAMAPETEPVDTTPPQRFNRSSGQSSKGTESRGKSRNPQFRSFERHTKGFGSKMMAKMGYVEGTGLGRDSQGIVDPLVASRLPKSRGLGANG